jgi:hypothetical protein
MQAHKDESRDAKETLLRHMEVFDVERKQTKGEEGAASTASEPMAANSVEECEREVDHAPLARHGIAFLGISPYIVESIFLCNCVPLSGSRTSLAFIPPLIKPNAYTWYPFSPYCATASQANTVPRVATQTEKGQRYAEHKYPHETAFPRELC